MNINPLQSSKKSDLLNQDSSDLGNLKGKHKAKKNKKINILFIIMFILLLLALGTAAYFFYEYTQLKPKVENPTQALDDQQKSIKENVGKIFEIGNPDDYSIASITNADNLKKENPEFYKNAKNGDYLLISSLKAILYDKERNIVLNVAPIINTNQSSNQSETPTPSFTQTNTPTIEPTKKR